MFYLLFIPLIRTLLLWSSEEHLGRFLLLKSSRRSAENHSYSKKAQFPLEAFCWHSLMWMSGSACGRDVQSSNLHWRAGERGVCRLYADYEESILVKWSRFMYLCLSWVGSCCFSFLKDTDQTDSKQHLAEVFPLCWMDVLLHSTDDARDWDGRRDFLPRIFKVGRSFNFIFLQEFFVFCNT